VLEAPEVWSESASELLILVQVDGDEAERVPQLEEMGSRRGDDQQGTVTPAKSGALCGAKMSTASATDASHIGSGARYRQQPDRFLHAQ
jgi:hypothetical protein